MTIRAGWVVVVLYLAACGEASTPPTPPATPAAAPTPLRSGAAFLTPETRALQDDAFANPGFLWVDRGRALFHAAEDGRAPCSSCHGADGQGLIGAAARHPVWDAEAATLVNLEGRINACRENRQDAPALAYESEELLSLTAYVAHLSQGLEVDVALTPPLHAAYAQGRAYFETKRGQFNIACAQCHDDMWGKRLRGDTISQGHGNGFPAYRLEWQSLGSLHRRFQDCDAGVRARPMALGSDTYVALEYYLAVRASGLAIETPAVRR